MCSLRQAHTWVHFPWSVYAVYLSGMINFAAVWDPLLVWCVPLYYIIMIPCNRHLTPFFLVLRNRTLTHTTWYHTSSHQSILLAALLVWILASKLVKIAPHFCARPADLVWLPAYVLFAYAHSFIKLYCALTFYNHSWNGRNLALTQMASVENVKQPDELRRRVPARPHALRGTTGLFGPAVQKEDSGVGGL